MNVAPVPPCPSIQLLTLSHPARREQPASRAVPVLCGTRVPLARRVRGICGCVCQQRSTCKSHGCLKIFTPSPVTSDTKMSHNGRSRCEKFFFSPLCSQSLRQGCAEPSPPERPPKAVANPTPEEQGGRKILISTFNSFFFFPKLDFSFISNLPLT